jgi:hypothetical protein
VDDPLVLIILISLFNLLHTSSIFVMSPNVYLTLQLPHKLW